MSQTPPINYNAPTYSDGTVYSPNTRHPFIVFEGVDSSGKTTISRKVSQHLNAYWSCEPYLLVYVETINFYKKALTFAGDRAVHCNDIGNSLKKHMCITDRYYYSNIVYQSTLDHVSRHWLYSIQPPNLIKPDLIFFCTGDLFTIHERCLSKGENWDYETLQQLNSAYYDVLQTENYIEINTTNQTIDQCVEYCVNKIKELLKQK